MSLPPSSPPSSNSPFSRPRPNRVIRETNEKREEHRLNERIRVPQVRLIDQNGEQKGILSTQDALRMARDAGLDLMEVAPEANPPVCKIVDYGKFKYEKKKKEHQAKRKQTVIKVKEVQLRPQTDEHDLDYKFRNVRQFLLDGDKAKISIMFRGREVSYVDNGYRIMEKLINLVKDVSIVESSPKLEGKRLIMVLAPSSMGTAASSVKKIIVTPNSVSSGGDRGANST